MLVEIGGIQSFLSVGDRCTLVGRRGETVACEVVGFRDDRALAMPFGALDGIGIGSSAEVGESNSVAYPSYSWLGRVVDAFGKPLDGKGTLALGKQSYPVKRIAPPAHARGRVAGKIDLGIKSLNAFATCCRGQRLGIFSASGVGKSILLSMLARYSKADVVVIGLVGERGREVKEFLDQELGEEGLMRSVLVVATSDESPLMRRQAAYLTMTVAEFFRDQGLDVLCLMDSVTRFAMAQREIGLSVGEPPATRGYTPSVFAKLPMLMERAGTTRGEGSITGLYTVLVEADDMNDPIGDTSRSILDGHVVLSRNLAAQNHYPAIDVSVSLSRLMSDIASSDHQAAASQFRQTLADYESIRDAYNIGAYTVGMNPQSDYAIENLESMNSFLRQDNQPSGFDQTVSQLTRVFNPIEDSSSSA